MSSIPEEVQDYLDRLNVESVSNKDIKKAMNFLEERGLLESFTDEVSEEKNQ